MQSFRKPVYFFAIAITLAATATAATANAATADLFRPAATTNSAKIVRAGAAVEPELRRTRIVQPDVALLSRMALQMDALVPADSTVRLGFFDDVSLVVEFNATVRVGGSTVLTGVVPGIPRSAATFVVKEGAVVGNVHTAGLLYQLRFRQVDGATVHEAREIDPSLFRDHDKNYDAFVQQEAERVRKAPPEGAAKASVEVSAADDGSLVDVLVAYTSAARNGAGGAAAIVSQIELAVAETNLSYQNSGVVHRLRLVKTLEVDYTETGSSSTDLTRLRAKNDKMADEVHAYRAAYGADIVSLIVERMDDACGIGYLMTNVATSFTSSAFNVVARGCATGIYAFGHEVGHNMGLRHDVYEDPGTTPFPDAHGYVELGARFRTVMAYNDACTAQGFSCRRTANFSNPDILLEGVPTGLTATANAVRVLNSTRTTVAGFTPALDLSNGGPILFFKISYSGTEGNTVQLSVERLTGAPGSASVQYSTVAGTAVSGTDFVPASGTITWGNGDFAPKNITVTLLQDELVEPSKSFTVVLSNPVGAILGANSTATVTVLDDEAGVFPPGCVVPAGWNNNVDGSRLGWIASTDNAGEGRCSLKSGPIGDSGSNSIKVLSRVSVTGNFLAGTVRFARRVSSENTFDCFRFIIDGVQQDVGGQCSASGGIGASGEVPWGSVEFPLSAARHTLTWSYEKDANTADGEDAVWIDDVRLPQEGILLTVTKSGNGSGTITSTPGGISCGSSCTYVAPANSLVTLTATATASDTFTGWSGACAGTGSCTITLDASKLVTATFDAALGSKPLDYTDLWWGGESENGWGISITQHTPSDVQFNAFYVYEANGTPTWYVMPGGTWNSNFTAYTGALYRPTGSPLDKYNASQMVVGASVGNATLTFISATAATVTYTINGISASKNIVRQSFGVPATVAGLKVGDLWWGGATQNGWGVSIAQQFNTLFGVWYTYASNGQATWYVMPGGNWFGNTYIGNLYSTTGSPWLGAAYNPGTLVATAVGSLTLKFTPDAAGTASSSALMTYTFNPATLPGGGFVSGYTQDKSISRQGF